MGPTATGKTGLALQLAAYFPVEIISVDSALVYTDMNIGTAKPSDAERAEVPHHLIDICTPTEAYSVGQFIRDAQQIIFKYISAVTFLYWSVAPCFIFMAC